MTKYRVINQDRLEVPSSYGDNLDSAIALREKYGLPHSLQIIILVWENYSDSLGSWWLNPDKESVEREFNVTLEEIED